MQNLLKALGDRRAQLADKGESQKGFTLVELLVVVIIIGILAGIAIPVFLNQREAAWRAEVETDLRNAALAIETRAVEEGGAYDTAWNGELIGAPDLLPSNAATTFTLSVPDTRNFTIVADHPDLTDNATYTSSTSDITWP